MTESVSPIGQSGGLIHHLNNRTEPETPRSNFEWLHYCIRHEGIEDLLCQQLGENGGEKVDHGSGGMSPLRAA